MVVVVLVVGSGAGIFHALESLSYPKAEDQMLGKRIAARLSSEWFLNCRADWTWSQRCMVRCESGVLGIVW